MTTMTVVETITEDRLSPLETTVIKKKIENQPINLCNKNLLMRSSSFDRLKQFPTYFCRQSSAELAVWLGSLKVRLSSNLSHFSKQCHGITLTLAIYSVVVLLAVQLFVGLMTLATIAPPIGLIFLFGCIVLISSLAMCILNRTSNTQPRRTLANQRQSRSREPILRQEHKKIQ